MRYFSIGDIKYGYNFQPIMFNNTSTLKSFINNMPYDQEGHQTRNEIDWVRYIEYSEDTYGYTSMKNDGCLESDIWCKKDNAKHLTFDKCIFIADYVHGYRPVKIKDEKYIIVSYGNDDIRAYKTDDCGDTREELGYYFEPKRLSSGKDIYILSNKILYIIKSNPTRNTGITELRRIDIMYAKDKVYDINSKVNKLSALADHNVDRIIAKIKFLSLNGYYSQLVQLLDKKMDTKNIHKIMQHNIDEWISKNKNTVLSLFNTVSNIDEYIRYHKIELYKDGNMTSKYKSSVRESVRVILGFYPTITRKQMLKYFENNSENIFKYVHMIITIYAGVNVNKLELKHAIASYQGTIELVYMRSNNR